MRLVVTGGGTGGHVYPALEVARAARARGWSVRYLGSERGQEGPACLRERLPFEAFPSEPLVSLRTPRGWRAAARLLRAVGMARRSLRCDPPDFVFATGGYSAAPVLRAAMALRLPFGLHEQNAVPGRTIAMAGPKAAFVGTVFRATEARLPGCRVVRTGMPVRGALREAAARGAASGPTASSWWEAPKAPPPSTRSPWRPARA
ncbi:MAG: UDP-N-acetylglucosamine--N-acetylmuramyl-(pentapeptide) pyrophosphoryl-undecaprenol N-acetylglucosamine transferase [Fimbriimonadales bacterium]|nr:UDP-N-acetylglucosamine--N-acetylmuramyl-(pentapeptide) pyrophosphoryl-undecaprenol N-acetylglucosamine transferase [Fimbriimonadales bacterium]